jgi:hypothetical protein
MKDVQRSLQELADDQLRLQQRVAELQERRALIIKSQISHANDVHGSQHRQVLSSSAPQHMHSSSNKHR